MSGGGKIIEKRPMALQDGKEVVRYWLMSQSRPGWHDETCVYAEPAGDEPQLGDTIWWGGEQVIYFGPNDSKRLTKVGYSFHSVEDIADHKPEVVDVLDGPVIEVTNEVISYIARYGGKCRDCADEDGICPSSGLPCEGYIKAIRHVLEALNYGVANGYIAKEPPK